MPFIKRCPGEKTDLVEIKDRGVQTKYRENEAQTAPWKPPYKKRENIEAEEVVIDPVLNLDSKYFTQNDVDLVKWHRKKVQWENYLIKSFNPKNAEQQKMIIERIEKEKWRLKGKEIDRINELRMEAAHKELAEQRAIIQERMDHRMTNAKKKFDDIKRANEHKYQLKLEREIRRTNLKLQKFSDKFPQKRPDAFGKQLCNKQNKLVPIRVPHEVLCLDPATSSLTNVYQLLEKNLAQSEPLKKSHPKTHDCNIPKFYIIEKEEGLCPGSNTESSSDILARNRKKEEDFKNSKSLITALIVGRGTQNRIYQYVKINYDALNEKYGRGKKLFNKGMKEEEKFRKAVLEGIEMHNIILKMREKVQGVVREFEGKAISNILDFTAKEYFRLRERNRLLGLALIAEKEKWGREAKESSRRQEEELRLKQHEEIYKEIMKTHEISSDTLLEAVIEEQVEETGCGIATLWTKAVSDNYKEIFEELGSEEDPYRKLEYAARLADRCLSTQSENARMKANIKGHIKEFEKYSKYIVDNLGALTEESDSTTTSESSTRDKETCYDKADARSVSESSESINQKQSGFLNKLLKSDIPQDMTDKAMTSVHFDIEPRKSEEETEDNEQDSKKVISINIGKPTEEIDIDLKEVSEMLLSQVIEKAESYIEQYKENAEKLGLPPEFPQQSYPETLSDTYQFLSKELLKTSGKKSKTKIEQKVRPWVESLIDKAITKMTGMFYPLNEESEVSSWRSDPSVIFKPEDFYYCPETTNKEKDEASVDSKDEYDCIPEPFGDTRKEVHELKPSESLEYVGILVEGTNKNLLPEEDKTPKLHSLIKREK